MPSILLDMFLFLLAASDVHGCVVSDEFVWSGVGRGQSFLPVRDPASFCFLTSARAWNYGSCGLRFDALVSAWALEFAANLDAFQCGARCVSNCSGLVRITNEARLRGKGRHEAALAVANQSVCALTYGQDWYNDA